jgi:NAD(P)-dependent dehydrogenase (short-subunit alcohol dehydrogenase family)
MKIQDLFSLENECAVVIGGSGKIGMPISEALAEAGADVIIATRTLESAEKAITDFKSKGLSVDWVRVDQASEVSVKNCIEESVRLTNKFPKILINCGVERPMQGRFYDDTVDNWDKSMQVNARGLFVTCREFANVMATHGGGSIINVSSVYGVVAPDPRLYEGSDFETEPDYPYTKGGMIAFSNYLAAKFAHKKIRVNVLAPGGYFNNQPQPFLDNYCKKVPLGRMALYDDLKGPVVFLASQASSYITGQTICVDGGFTTV